MTTLPELAQTNPTWSLEEFVDVTNELLPQYLPTKSGNAKVREELTPRLVRHYTSLGMLDLPHKSGKYALYTYRHLLQILVVRRLLAEGIGANTIDRLAIQKDNAELENLLAGGVQLNFSTANPALAYLQQIQKRGSTVSQPLSPSESKQPSTSAKTWTRLEIIPGLEVHVREDFNYPKSASELHSLVQYITQNLKKIATRKRK